MLLNIQGLIYDQLEDEGQLVLKSAMPTEYFVDTTIVFQEVRRKQKIMYSNSFSGNATILDSNFKAAIIAFEEITTLEKVKFSSKIHCDNYCMWRISSRVNWIWEFDVSKQYWSLDNIGGYTTISNISRILNVIAPFLIEARITMFDQNSDDLIRSFIRFIVKNGIVYQQNADNYWPEM